MISLYSAVDAAAVPSLAELYALCEEENKERESINCLGMCVFGNCCTTDDKHIDWCRTSCKDSVAGCGEKLEKCKARAETRAMKEKLAEGKRLAEEKRLD